MRMGVAGSHRARGSAPTAGAVASHRRCAVEGRSTEGGGRGRSQRRHRRVQESRRQQGNRAIAAKALIHMADCYQKLGDAEARTIFEQVVREFADQREEVALARVRLGGASTAANVRGDRAVWTGPNVDLYARVSPDGRFITYVDGSDGRLMIHDIAPNVDRALTPAAGPSIRSRRSGRRFRATASRSYTNGLLTAGPSCASPH